MTNAQDQNDIKKPISCEVCGATKATKPAKDGSAKLPHNWKRTGSAPICSKCWNSKAILRGFSFPVAEPIDCTWSELRDDLAAMWADSTSAANWIASELYNRDVRRSDQDKMPKWSPPYLYPQLTLLYPKFDRASLAALEQSIKKQYRAKRYDVIWTHAAATSSYRYPYPYSVRADNWKFWFGKDNELMISLPINGHNRTIRLKGGPRYKRFVTALRQMKKQGSLDILRKKDGTIMCKIVGWINRHPTQKREATLYVRTCADRLLSAEVLNGNTGIIGIYGVTGPTGMIYVGQSINIKERWLRHKTAVTDDSYYSEKLKADVARYGWSAFTFEVLEETLNLDERELYWIRRYNSHVDGYTNQSEYDRLTNKDPRTYRGNEEHRQVWAENCDHLKELVDQYDARLFRLSQDRKAEMNRNKGFQRVRDDFAEKYDNRMNSGIKEIAAHLVNFAVRRKFGRVLYDDCARWIDKFRYFALEAAIRAKCDEAGIIFEKRASGLVTPEIPEPLENRESLAA